MARARPRRHPPTAAPRAERGSACAGGSATCAGGTSRRCRSSRGLPWRSTGSTARGSTRSRRNAATVTSRPLHAQNVRRGPSFRSYVATVKGSKIGIYHSPTDPAPYTRLPSPNGDGARVAFLVKKLEAKWAYVYLPTRPNGSTGWIRRSKVTIGGDNYHVKINLTRHFLTAWKGKDRLLKTPVGVGRAVTPTPPGLYYITELLKPTDPTGTYGPYAFGLSVHSNVLHEFAGGDGVLGLHGTNYPQGIGTNVSHGCIRMANQSI